MVEVVAWLLDCPGDPGQAGGARGTPGTRAGVAAPRTRDNLAARARLALWDGRVGVIGLLHPPRRDSPVSCAPTRPLAPQGASGTPPPTTAQQHQHAGDRQGRAAGRAPAAPAPAGPGHAAGVPGEEAHLHDEIGEDRLRGLHELQTRTVSMRGNLSMVRVSKAGAESE